MVKLKYEAVTLCKLVTFSFPKGDRFRRFDSILKELCILLNTQTFKRLCMIEDNYLYMIHLLYLYES